MKKASNFLINIFFFPLLLISFLGSLLVLVNQMINLQNEGLVLLNILVILFFVILFLIKRKRFSGLAQLLGKSNILFYCAIILLFCWQVFMIFTLSGFSVWDPGIIINAAMRKQYWVPNYFSLYPNTLPLLFFEHFIWVILGHPSIKVLTIVLNSLNLILMDSAIALLIKEIAQKSFAKKVQLLISFSFIVLLIVTPWVCLPYSDVSSFAFSSYLLLTFWKISEKPNFKLYLLAGFILFIDYLLKPSTIIPLIAFIIVELVFLKNKHNHYRKNIIGLLLLLISFTVFLFGLNIIKTNNNIVSIDKQRSFGMAHYAAMGISGSLGGYYIKDVTRDTNIKNRDERNKMDMKIWKKRLKSKGFIGYESFLIKKQINNTSDGSFGWGKEGIFIRSFNSHPSISKQLYMNKNDVAQEYNQNISWIFQIVWVVLLFGMFFALPIFSFKSQFLKYTVVGFWIFLLIFEGGRSRYLIQMLPYIFILSGLGFDYMHKSRGQTK